MKSTSLRQASSKEKELGIKRGNSYMATLGENCPIYIEEGFNIREIDESHVANIQSAYEQGNYVPAIVVKPTPEGLKVTDGHHRWIAAQQACISAIEVKEFTGDDIEQLAFMITSSQGRNLNPLERAQAYQRLSHQGMSEKLIAETVRRSLSDVRSHLTFLNAGPKIIKAVKEGKLGFGATIDELNKHGFDGVKKIEEAVEKAAETGTKVTRATMQGFTKTDYKKVMEILCSEVDNDFLPAELQHLIKKYSEI